MSDRLQALRAQVDEINSEILKLLNKRAELTSSIGKVQQELGMTFYDPEREGQMLQALEMKNNGPFSNETIKHLFKEIFKASLAMEEKEARAKILVQRAPGKPDTVVRVGDDCLIGDGSFQVISGPCAVEDWEQMDTTAAALAARGVKILRGMAFKPRSSPYEFQGLGQEGLELARRAANKYGMYITSEILDASQLDMMYDYTDIFWVGSRNMYNSTLLRAVGRQRKPVILKRGLSATMQEWLYAAEYIASQGNTNIILIERGIRTYETWTRNTLDISAIPVLKLESHLPIIVDVSHSTGRRDIMKPMARIAKASGADGLMIEVHPNPPVALSDAKQQITIPEFHAVMDELGLPYVESVIA